MTVVVTGIGGFIGMHTAAHLLARGETVVGIDNFNDYYPVALKEARIAELARMGSDRLAIHRADVGDEAALATALADTDFDRIVPLAAQAGVRYSLDNPATYVRSNVAGHGHPGDRAPPRPPQYGLCIIILGLWREHGHAFSRRGPSRPSDLALSRD